ncbi:hypothetical protein CBR_g19221 [Chara braunii]|uniref:Cytochrome b5 heme-binding domain-containing protein n=1 Tax=Chara braunii TaxID=69332 RepID=A0A388JTM9_CHABU|nr:hypothetical protein CBR_g19221 [Chara braunii]|eukprot:GBG61145.1 hypothetical protein CBR_g19221 [Chara braunii]
MATEGLTQRRQGVTEKAGDREKPMSTEEDELKKPVVSTMETELERAEAELAPRLPQYLGVFFAAGLTFMSIYILWPYAEQGAERVFTAEELALYDGVKRKQLLLAILGDVFDVTEGQRHYGPGNGYHHFVGKDASRAFVTGKFTDGLTDDVSGLSASEYSGLQEWHSFYVKSDKYRYVGKLAGRFYDEAGRGTKALEDLHSEFKKAERMKELQIAEVGKYPTCNSRWSSAEGGFVSCTSGYPRKVFITGGTTSRCACFQYSELDQPNQEAYPDCDPYATECQVSQPGT